MSNDSDSFIQEVDESLRQDKAMLAIKRYGPWLLALFVVFLIGVIGWQWWRNHTIEEARRQSDQFAAALQQAANGDLAGAKTAFAQLSESGPQAYRVMARMEHAAILEAEGDLQAALAEYDAAAEAARDDIMRQSAEMRAAYLVAETQDFQAVQARLQPMIDKGGPISFLAQELLAVEAWEAGQTDLARTTLQNLELAFGAPESVRQRAQLALAVLGPAPGDENAAEADEETPAREPAEGESK